MKDYLKRITCDRVISPDIDSVAELHERHVLSIPFENLDIYSKKLFDLKIENIYRKVVENNRGGFCYELNLLFNELLIALGFKSRIIEARIYTENGEPGPAFDHMAVLVETDKRYLADVGFGDLFLRPLEITGGIQSDGRNLFRIEQLDEFRYLLAMAKDDRSFERKYVFDLRAVRVEDFCEMSLHKQTSSDSYFVKNLVCTLPTEQGRITIFNKNLIERKYTQRIVSAIDDSVMLKRTLAERFNVIIDIR